MLRTHGVLRKGQIGLDLIVSPSDYADRMAAHVPCEQHNCSIVCRYAGPLQGEAGSTG